MTSPAIVREALEVGERFLNSCFSAWSCGEPTHRVKTMLDNADKFRAALNALAALDATPGEGVLVPREQLRDWYTQAFAMFVALTPEDDEDDRRTPKLMSEMEALFAPANPASEPAQ